MWFVLQVYLPQTFQPNRLCAFATFRYKHEIGKTPIVSYPVFVCSGTVLNLTMDIYSRFNRQPRLKHPKKDNRKLDHLTIIFFQIIIKRNKVFLIQFLFDKIKALETGYCSTLSLFFLPYTFLDSMCYKCICINGFRDTHFYRFYF